MLSGTVMPIADKVKKLRSGMQAHSYNETSSNPEKVTRTIVEKDGQKKGEFLKVGDKVVESSTSADVKTAGIDLSGECVATNPTIMAGNMDDDNVVQDKDDVNKEEAIKKSAAPMAFSFGSTLQKVEKFRKCNSLNKATGVTRLSDKQTHTPYRGEVSDQKSKEKALGITQRLRNHMKGKLAVIQGSKQDAKPELKAGLNQQEIAAANNQKVDVSKYKKPAPQEDPKTAHAYSIGNPVQSKPKLSLVPPPPPPRVSKQPEPKPQPRFSPAQEAAFTKLHSKIKEYMEAAKQRTNDRATSNVPAKQQAQQQSHLKIV